MQHAVKVVQKSLTGSVLTDDERAYLHALVDSRPSTSDVNWAPSPPASYIREVLIALVDERFERASKEARYR